jgi:hypothetical protein
MKVGYLFANEEEQQRDDFMRRAYVAIMSFPDEALTNVKLTTEMKIIALQNIISYFEKIEEYEKCYDLLELTNQLKDVGKNKC